MIIVVAKISFESQVQRDRAVELSAPVQKATRILLCCRSL